MTYPQGGQYMPPPAQVPAPRWPMLVIGLVVGLVLGGGGVALGWLLSGPGSGDTAAADVGAACAALERTPSELDPEKNFAGFRRLGAAAELAAAAAEADAKYQPLADAVRRPIDIFQRTFGADSPEFAEAMAKARQACATR